MPDEGDSDSIDSNKADSILQAIAHAPPRALEELTSAVPSSKRFTIQRRLGEGGMGTVYAAFDNERSATVALKTLRRGNGAEVARFKREFRSIQGLAHPNLVGLDELFFENDRWFFTMELLDGEDFVTHVTGRPASVAFQSTIRESAGKLAVVREGAEAPSALHSFDEERLRSALRQLLEGLSALHAADKVHRDIKPSNVIVTREGRVVLLDFGLVTEASSSDRSTMGAVVGTPAYMAPEQAASGEVGPAADLYAVGVMLYEVLTGRVPIDGPPLQVLLEKQRREPEPPASIAPGVPADLNALCVSLLRFDPSHRPTGEEVFRVLAGARVSEVVLPRGSTGAPLFVGRSVELAALRAAFDATAEGELSAALVCGESGIGKSYTVRRFLEQLLAEHPEAVVLEGRCYERETVPYKTLDGTVDALSRRLSHMSAADVAALLPSRSASLAQIFPAMLRVPQIAKEHASLPLTTEPHELRQRAFGELRELFTRVAIRRPTVIVIDDLQWADDDGLRALAEILRYPDAPPLLLLGTVRLAPGEAAGLDRLRAAIPGEPSVIRLASLERGEARELARALLRRADASGADPDSIATEAGGHPLFVEELARHVALGGSARDDVKLDEAIWARILELEGPTREMAELIALAGKPIAQEVAAVAAHVEPAEFNRRSTMLRVSNLVRTGGARWADAIEPYHDRVREAVLAHLDPERKRRLHEALATAFEGSSHHDAEMLATHWKEAGNGSRAARYAELAGDQAAKTCAFDRAAQWYGGALELSADSTTGRRELRVKLAEALSNAGRGALAAPQFEAAAVDSPPIEAIDLRRRAAVELLRSGHFAPGIQALRVVLTAIGIRMPTTRLGGILTILYYRLRVRMRGLGFREREKGQILAEQLTRLDTASALAMTLGFQDNVLGMAFSAHALLLALATGDVDRIVRSLGMEAAFIGVQGSRGAIRRAQQLIARAREIDRRSVTSEARAFVAAASFSTLYGSGRYREAVEEHATVLDHIRQGSAGMVYEQASSRWFLTTSLALLGRFRELRREQSGALRDAIARGDVFLSVIMRIWPGALVWLAEDRPDLAEKHSGAAMVDWPKKGFHIQHCYAIAGEVQVKLYSDDIAGAHARATELLRRASRSVLWRYGTIRFRALHFRAGTALAMVERGLGDRRALLRDAERDARRLERENVPWMRPFAKLTFAGIALRSGARAEAIGALEAAAREFEAGDMSAYAAAARDRSARLRDDASTASEIERAAAFFRSEEVVSPERMIAMLVPGMSA